MQHLPPTPPEPGRNQQPPVHQQPWVKEQPSKQQQSYYQQKSIPDDGFQEEGGDPPKAKVSGAVKLLLSVLIVAATLFFLRYYLFTINKVHFTGLRKFSQTDAARLTGLDSGLFYFTLTENFVQDSVESNHYFIYESMAKVFPNGLSVKVIERYPFAFFTHLGVGYILAQDGFILRETRDLKEGSQLIHVNGLAVWGQQIVGSFPNSTDPSQGDSMMSLFQELEMWGFKTEIAAIDMSQTLNISMQTKDGYTINLGSEENLHAKIGTVASVVNELRRRKMTGGIIEATLPGEATYRSER
ncbi:MAG: FtsQ-type POTRA domain-containing protein [Clostridiales bacterium]|nr:FtsQ-type POTRA domain-containing protein [Clostridiales bacterium]